MLFYFYVPHVCNAVYGLCYFFHEKIHRKIDVFTQICTFI